MGSIIRNVELIDADVTGEGSVGALAGWNNGLVENMYATGEVNGDGDAVGGLIGENDGTVTGSHFDGTVTTVAGNESVDFAGGLIGVNYDNGSITDCYAISTVTSEVGYGTGGLVGANSGPINDSHAICSVTGNDTVGGLVGENNIGTIDNSYADGDVTGSSYVGGLTGFNEFTITDSYFTGTVTASGDCSGGLVGESSGSIQGCHADATVTSAANYVGGLAGYSRGASFSYATGSVTGGSYVGGLIGESYRNFASDVIDASYSTSAVTGHSHIGGLAGSNEADISASYAKGDVTGVEKAGIDSTYAGGLVGRNTGPISISYAWGDVSGHEYVGGLVGYNEGPDATIFNCYEIGAVDGNEGSFVGPLIGRLNLLSSEDIIGSFWNNNTSGHVSSDWGISEGSVTMMQQATYVNEGWNFDTIWGINTVDNNRYPFLRWQFDAEFAGGNGSADNPFLVATADHLNNVRNHLDQHFRQIENLDLSFYRSDSGWVPIGTSGAPFTGTYDGDGHVISDLFIDQVGVSTVYTPAGLFGYTGVEAEICNLTLEDVDITGCYYVGSLVGNNSGEISNVSSSGIVIGEWDTGGLAGLNSGSIIGSSFTGTVTGTDEIEYGEFTGGLVGYNTGGTITKCQANATVVSEGDSVGGLAGESLIDAVITESCAMGSVRATNFVGGLVGSNDGEITVCYSTCTVDGSNDVGGLAGGNSGPITNSYAVGTVTGTNDEGGLVGSSTDEIITHCYWDINTTVQNFSACGTGKTTAEMKQQATFENWDFITVWDMNTVDNNGYPFLRWQLNVPPVLSGTGVDSITDTTAALSFTSDRNGIYYYLVYTATEDAPDAAAIKAQGAAAAKGTGAAAAAANTVGLADLTASTEYNAYIMLEYTEWNTSAVATISFTTEAELSEFAGGDGSAENPFLVADADQLNNVRNHLDKHFLQTHDINLSGYSGGEGWEPIGDNSTPFTGTYDGNELSINNLFIERDDEYIGLFGYIAAGGNVSDLELNPVDITSSAYYVGGLAGRNNGLIDNCSVSGTVSINGWYYPVGGLIGENHGMITNCSFDGTVEGEDDYCGGLVGWDEGTIIDCHTTGTVRGDDEVGGLVGYKVSGIIRGSHSECTVTALNLNSTQTGGLVGNNDGEIDGCYALGAVTGNDYVGGLVGFNYSPGGAIVNSYATGSVTGNDYVGGLVGGNGKSITDCYSSGAVVTPAASANTGGLAGYTTAIGVVTDSFWNTETSGKNTSVGGTGKTTAEMKQQATFTDWDFTTVWGINSTDNGGYPFLRWQGYVPTAPAGGSNGSRTAQTSVYQAIIRAEDGTETAVAVLINRDDGFASIEEDPWHGMPQGELAVTIPAIPGVDAYALSLPVRDLSTPDAQGMLEISTEQGSVAVPSNMLTGMGETAGNQARITIGSADRSALPEGAAQIIGDRPLVQLELSIDGRQLDWNNPQAPVRVSIPYAPTAAELDDPEHIVVVYVDGAGNLHSVPNGRYDAETGTVTFTTTHFSHYAVAYVHKTFEDLEAVLWGKKQIEVLASKGIIKGMSQTAFAPEEAITRADFLCLLVRTLGWEGEPEGSFGDVAVDTYYWRETGIAKELGIVDGVGNDRFDPDSAISRQDMMVMTERALGVLNGSAMEGAASGLDRFADRAQIAGYAVSSIAALAQEGLVEGSDGEVNPRGKATRAETAVFLYRVYNREY
ncbi:MAG: GLUG motif-containing protein [Eubacteriales bacterium]|nr:GLUG motif-containing protein [Eubacteriales bacterium]